MQVGLFFGSFNPIHIGHLMLATYMVEYTDMDQVWFVVSPQNPHKKNHNLLDENHRYDLVYEAIKNDPRFRVSNVEFNMPKPSYTSDTLVVLNEKYPKHVFSLIMGEDNLKQLHKWKNVDFIIDNYKIYVYPRADSEVREKFEKGSIIKVDAPRVEISASFIRNAIKSGKNISNYLPQGTWELIDKAGYYL